MSPVLSKSEKAVLLFIARKTYGYHKKSDQISLSQFKEKLHLSHQGIVNILKRLQLVNICRLVNRGNSRLAFSEWLIDTSDYANKLVHLSRLVKFSINASHDELVNIRRHTKERYTKESVFDILPNASSKETIVERLKLLLGETYKFDGKKHYRKNLKGWNEIHNPEAYLKSIESNNAQPLEETRKIDGRTFDYEKQIVKGKIG